MSLIIIYHSAYGHTQKLAEAILKGVKPLIQASELIAIDSEGNIPEKAWDKLKQAETILFGSPTYMGSVSWQFKKFADASSKTWSSQRWKDKLAGGFTSSASIDGDKASTLHYMVTFAMQHAMLWAGCDLLPSNTQTAVRNDPNYLGSFTGLISQSPSDASVEEAPPYGDLQTAQLFGKRMARLTIDRQR
jgi:NAD(P)H dehydrogenase (quinone)